MHWLEHTRRKVRYKGFLLTEAKLEIGPSAKITVLQARILLNGSPVRGKPSLIILSRIAHTPPGIPSDHSVISFT